MEAIVAPRGVVLVWICNAMKRTSTLRNVDRLALQLLSQEKRTHGVASSWVLELGVSH